MDYQHMPKATKYTADTRKGQQRGLTTTGGQTNTPALATNPPARPISKEKAISIRSLLHRAGQAKKSYWTTRIRDRDGKIVRTYREGEEPCRVQLDVEFPGHTRSMFREETIDYPGLTEAEVQRLEYYKRPAHRETIHAYLLKIAAEKHLKGDVDHKSYLIADYVERLVGATELQLFWASEYFIEKDTDSFFPTLAALKSRVFENQ